jgi:hypothetical protein
VRRSLLLASLTLLACGSTGGQIASKVAGAALDGVGRSGGSSPEPEKWSTHRGSCGVFGEYGMACPVLPGCAALAESHDPVTLNVCDSGGSLRAITTCKGWQGSVHWCRAGAFPPCDGWLGRDCGSFETIVCADAEQEQRVLRCCTDETECAPNTYFEPRRIEAHSESTGLMSTIGVPSIASSGPTFSRRPSISSTVTR